MSKNNYSGILKLFAAFIFFISLVFFISDNTGNCKRNDEQKPCEVSEVGVEVLSLQESFVKVADAVKPAVVNISAIRVEEYSVPQHQFFYGSPFDYFFDDFFGNPPSNRRQLPEKKYKRKYEGAGSGVVIDPKGYIVTNEHVVRGATEIQVMLSDGSKFKGKVIGKDAKSDLAVVKIKSKNNLPFAKLGNSDRIKVGEWAIAIGSPFGLAQTVTSGIISAVRQSLNIEGLQYSDLIQTDAAINPGNSGGPLCNVRGEVIGINTAIYAPTGVFSGVGFAIPINNAKAILDDLITKGKVVRGWLGIEIIPVNKAIAKHFNISGEKGVLINKVLSNSPAEKSGLLRGDIILKINDKKISDIRKLQAMVVKFGPNKKIKIQVLRDNKKINLSLITGEMPSVQSMAEGQESQEQKNDQQIKRNIKWNGAEFTDLSDEFRKRFGVEINEQGVIVINIENGSLSQEMGLVVGDVIRSLNRKKVASVNDFEKISKKVKLSEGIVFDINRNGKLIYISYVGK